MEIIIKVPTYSDGEVNAAFMKEIQTGFQMERSKEKERIAQSAKEAKANVGKTHPILGKCVAHMPARDYFRLVQKYGHDTVNSKEFLQYFNKKFPELSPNKA
jgi:hypothetical protein|tara:strand:- start:378 stop:683 length:306 start_codon:yes stop_codon:yes gene_type:complete